MRTRQRGTLGVTGLLLVLAVLATLSARSGGPVSWHITTGGSMLPGITPGTLVVVHRQGEYVPGDVVAYRSAMLQQTVLHRVVEVQDERLVLQGDNNDFLDPERPRHDEALGARVFQVEGLGLPLRWLRQPAVLAGAAALVVCLLLASGRRRRRSRAAARRRSPPPPVGSPAATATGRTSMLPTVTAAPGRRASPPAQVEPSARWGLGLSVAVLALASTGPFVHSVPDTSPAEGQRTITWSYGAHTDAELVYPGGVVEEGDVLYPRLVEVAEVTAELALDLPEDAEVSGSWRLDVSVENSDGWQKTTSTGAAAAVGAARTQELTTQLPVRELLELSRRVEAEAGVGGGAVTVDVRAVLDLVVTANGSTTTSQTSSELTFDAGTEKVTVDPSTPLVQQAPLDVGAPATSREVEIAGVRLPAGPLRDLALLGTLVSLLLLGVVHLRRLGEDEDARIRRTAGRHLVNADLAEDPDQVIDVDSFAALERIAELYERVLMCGDHAGIPFYYVLDGRTAYRYYTAEAARRLDAAESAGEDEETTHEVTAYDVPEQRTDGSTASRVGTRPEALR